MNRQCLTRYECALRLTNAALAGWLALVMAGCQSSDAPAHPGSRDQLLGWFQRGTNQSVIPVFQRGSIYYSVCHGVEIPLQECSEGLEWAHSPSSMTGTKLGWDTTNQTYYLAVMDSQASNFTDGRYGCGEKEPLTRVEKPAGLLEAEAAVPHKLADFLGSYQPVWFPWVRIEIRKQDGRYVSQHLEFRGPEPGSWLSTTEVHELTPLPDQSGFTGFERGNSPCLRYNRALRRFELELGNTPNALRMPLARLTAPDMAAQASPLRPLQIGIPSWR